MVSEQWRAIDEWQHMRWLVVDESDNKIADCFGPDAQQHAEQIVADHNAALAAADRGLVEEVERLREIVKGAWRFWAALMIDPPLSIDRGYKLLRVREDTWQEFDAIFRASVALSSGSVVPEGD